MKRGNSSDSLTVTGDLGPVATPLHVAPPTRPIPGGVEEEPTTTITALEADQVGSRQQERRRPRHRPQHPLHILRPADPPPAIPPDGRQDAPVILPLREDAIEPPEVAFRRAFAQRLGPEQAVEHDPESGNLTPRRGVIHGLLERRAVGEVDTQNAADVMLGLKHVTNITSHGGYGERMMDDG